MLAKFRSFNCIDCKNSLDWSVRFLQSFNHKLWSFGQFRLIISTVLSFTLSEPAICKAFTFFNPLMQLNKPVDVICNFFPLSLSNIRNSCRYLQRSPIHWSIASVTTDVRNSSWVTFGVSNWMNVCSFVNPIDNFMFNWIKSVFIVDGNCDRSQSSQLHWSILRAITRIHLKMNEDSILFEN